MNGRVWVKSKEPKHIIAAVRCLERVDPEGENLDKKSISTFLDMLDI
jgi:exosome complex component RRP40